MQTSLLLLIMTGGAFTASASNTMLCNKNNPIVELNTTYNYKVII